jgi:predicted ATPase
VAQLRKGLRSLTHLPDGREARSLEVDLQIAIGKALLDAHGFTAADASEAFVRARALCLSLAETTRLMPILYGQWLTAIMRPELSKARGVAEELLVCASERQDRLGEVMGHRSLGFTLIWLAELEVARDHLDRARTLYDHVEHRSSHIHYGYDALVLVLLTLALVLAALGYPQLADQRSHEALLHARRLGHPGTLLMAINSRCAAYSRSRDWQGLKDQADALIALATEQGFPTFLTYGTFSRGLALVGSGETATGVALMEASIVRYRELGQGLLTSPWLAELAWAYLQAGKVEQGLRCVAEGLELGERTDVQINRALLTWLRGQLLLSATPNNPVAAEENFQCGIDVARRQSARAVQLIASTSLARLWRDQGKRTEARDLLAPIYGWFTEGFDTPYLKEAKTLLEELG